MDDKKKQFLSEWIVKKKQNIDEILTNFEKYPVDRRPIIYFELGLDAETIAVHSILLGDKPEAIIWFQESSKYYYLRVECQRSMIGTCSWDGEMGDCKDALYMAVLSSDRVLIDKCVWQTLGICKEFPQKHPMPGFKYHYLIALAYFLQGKPDSAMSTLEMMRTDNKQFGRSLVGLKESLRGLINVDKPGFVSGLNVLLDYHAKHVDSRMPYDLISIDSTVLIKVARENGIIVVAEDIEKGNGKYIPWNLFD